MNRPESQRESDDLIIQLTRLQLHLLQTAKAVESNMAKEDVYQPLLQAMQIVRDIRKPHI